MSQLIAVLFGLFLVAFQGVGLLLSEHDWKDRTVGGLLLVSAAAVSLYMLERVMG